MLRKFKIIILLITGIYALVNSCSTFRKLFPLEMMYYPVFGNGYKITVFIEIKYTNGYITTGKIPTGITSWPRAEGLITEYIILYDINNNLLAIYQKDYLDVERQKKGNPKNELWVAYEGGLVLVPEEYQKGNDWQKYIESIKKKEF